MPDPDDDRSLSLEEIQAELSDLGRALLDQAIASALRARTLRAEIVRLSNSGDTG